MPNWCNNMLMVEGKAEDLKKFREAVKGEPTADGENCLLDFNKLISEEEDKQRVKSEWDKLTDKEKEQWKGLSDKPDFIHYWFNNGGYAWCLKNWGTKWNASSVSVTEHTPEKISYMFSTAWSPSEPVTREMGKRFPSLKFTHEFEEWGNAYAGVLEIINGKQGRVGTWEIDIGNCPKCDYTNIKPVYDDKYECADCGHFYTNDEVVEE